MKNKIINILFASLVITLLPSKTRAMQPKNLLSNSYAPYIIGAATSLLALAGIKYWKSYKRTNRNAQAQGHNAALVQAANSVPPMPVPQDALDKLFKEIEARMINDSENNYDMEYLVEQIRNSGPVTITAPALIRNNKERNIQIKDGVTYQNKGGYVALKNGTYQVTYADHTLTFTCLEDGSRVIKYRY